MTGSSTVQEYLIAMRDAIAHIVSIQDHLTTLRTLITNLKLTSQDEFRPHYLAEILTFFPQYSLKGLQCHHCVEDKYCWRGITQGYLCGLYFIGNHPDSTVQVRKEKILTMLWSAQGQFQLEGFIANTEFLDLLMLCYLTNANIKSLSKITNYGLRQLLFQLLCEKASPYVLTSENNKSILSLHSVNE